MERITEISEEFVISGDLIGLIEAIRNPGTAFIYDADGIIVDSPRKVFDNFNERNGTELAVVDPLPGSLLGIVPGGFLYGFVLSKGNILGKTLKS